MAITVTHTKVSTIPDGDDSSLIRPSDWNSTHTLTGLGTMAEQDANNVSITGGTITGVSVDGYIPSSEKAQPLGVATLDAGGKVPTSQIPLQGDLNYQGTWNATTNSPTLTSSTGTKGYYYVVDVAGTTNLNGIADWQIGDWAIFNGSVWQKVDNSDAGGDVVGPSSATDNAIARFDTTTGKLIQNSLVTIDDTGNVAGINSIEFDITPTTVPTSPGSLYWDSADGNQTLSLVMANGDAVQQIGEETYYRIKASAPITEGQVVMFTGTVGASGGLTGAPATGLTASTASYVMGIATHTLLINEWGYVTSFGLVRGIDTTGGAEAWVDGQILYLDPTVAGGLTKTLPTAPAPKVQVCAVIHADANGSLFIRPTFGGILGQYEGDVNITSPANGQYLVRDQTAGTWVNANLDLSAPPTIGNVTPNTGAFTNLSATGTISAGGSIGTSNTLLHGGATPAYSAVVEADISLSNNTTNNATTLRHGFLPILPDNASLFLNGQGNFATPAGASISSSYSQTAFSGQTTVNVIHNFGAYPVVQVMDGAGAVLVPFSITNNTVNDFTVVFSTSTSGTIIASVGSPQPQSVTIVSASTYTVLPTDRIVQVTSSSAFITLPTAVGNTGREFIINNASTGSITVNTTSSQLINNQLTQVVPSYSTMDVFSNGTGWWIV